MVGNWNRIIFYFAIFLAILFYAISFSPLIPDWKELLMGWNVFLSLGIYLLSLVMSVMKELPEKKGFMVFQLLFILILALNVLIFLGSTGFFGKEEAEALRPVGMLG